jgi:hypothetical protein
MEELAYVAIPILQCCPFASIIELNLLSVLEPHSDFGEGNVGDHAAQAFDSSVYRKYPPG